MADGDVIELGDELPEERPDVSLETVRRFVKAAQMDFPRFTDHEHARAEGLPGAVIPGIMSQGHLAAMIHRWAPGCDIVVLDTIFRTPMVVGTPVVCRGAVTNVEDDVDRDRPDDPQRGVRRDRRPRHRPGAPRPLSPDPQLLGAETFAAPSGRRARWRPCCTSARS